MAELSDRKRRAIEALLTSKSTAEAAAKSGIGARTIERWKRDPTFRDALRAAQTEVSAPAPASPVEGGDGNDNPPAAPAQSRGGKRRWMTATT